MDLTPGSRMERAEMLLAEAERQLARQRNILHEMKRAGLDIKSAEALVGRLAEDVEGLRRRLQTLNAELAEQEKKPSR